MGSQWPSMGKSLMKIPIFAKSIRKCHAILESKGVNLIRIVTENDSQIFKNILNSFVGIAAIQVRFLSLRKIELITEFLYVNEGVTTVNRMTKVTHQILYSFPVSNISSVCPTLLLLFFFATRATHAV